MAHIVRTSQDNVQRFERDEADSNDGRTTTMEATLHATISFVLVHVAIVVSSTRCKSHLFDPLSHPLCRCSCLHCRACRSPVRSCIAARPLPSLLFASHRKGHQFNRGSRPAPLLPLLFVSPGVLPSAKVTCLIVRCAWPPCRRSCLRRQTRRSPNQLPVVAHHPAAALVCVAGRKFHPFDRASRPAPLPPLLFASPGVSPSARRLSVRSCVAACPPAAARVAGREG
jgi:hypothetical protein